MVNHAEACLINISKNDKLAINDYDDYDMSG